MTCQRRTRRCAVAAPILVAVLTSITAAVALAAPAATPEPLTTRWGPELGSERTINLDWQGQTYETVSDTFIGYPISVPGDQAWRLLHVTNNGPCTGQLRVDVVNALANFPAATLNSELPDIIDLRWQVNGLWGGDSFANVIAGSPRALGVMSLARGATTDIIIGYEFPYDEERGRNLGFPSTELTFDVRLTIEGDETCLTPSPSASTISSAPSPGSSASGVVSASPGPSVSALATIGPGPSVSGVATDQPTNRPGPNTSPSGTAKPTPKPSPSASEKPKDGGLANTGAYVLATASVGTGLILIGLVLRRRRDH